MLWVCHPPKKGGYVAPALGLDPTTSLRGEFSLGRRESWGRNRWQISFGWRPPKGGGRGGGVASKDRWSQLAGGCGLMRGRMACDW